ncbi:MAG: hypothetical protein ABFC89_11850 [Methanospirillum sp.]
MVRTEWTTDGQQLVRDLAREDAAELFAGDNEMSQRLAGGDTKGKADLILRLDHQRKHAWYAPGDDAPGADWRETDYAEVLAWAWDRGLLLGPRDAAVYDRLDPRMQMFICNGEVYAVSDDGIVVDTDLQRSVTEAELRVEMSLAGGAEFCGPGCQAE